MIRGFFSFIFCRFAKRYNFLKNVPNLLTKQQVWYIIDLLKNQQVVRESVK